MAGHHSGTDKRMQQFTPQSRPLRATAAAFRVIDREAVIVDAAGGLVHIANETGSRIWELCDGSRTLAEIIEVLTDEFAIDAPAAAADAAAFLAELAAQNLLATRPG